MSQLTSTEQSNWFFHTLLLEMSYVRYCGSTAPVTLLGVLFV